MHDDRLVKLFERYRSTGDLVALGRVFDTVGPRLLRVARHVAARPDEAEDLVQATCLAAIEGAARYDAERPLEPWLVGILVNQARIGRRRRRGLDLDVAQPRDPGAAPGDELEEQELVAAVRTALESLPPRYREVLEPHLREGLRPLEIAERLHRPQGTVRAQLHRGLRLIRSMLPAGFALGAGALLAPRGWAAVRRNVMAEAERRAGVASRTGGAVASSGGVLALVLGVAAVAGLCGTLVLFARGGPRGDADLEGRAAAGRRTARAELVLDDAEASGEGRVPLHAAAPPSAEPQRRQSDRVAHPTGELVVTVVDDDGKPLAGERVTAAPWGGERWFASVRSAVSDADGRVRFAGVPAGRVGVHVDGSNAQSRAEVEPGATVELEVRGPRAVRVVGRVVDERGRGVEGAALCVARAADPAADPAANGDLAGAAAFAIAARSGADGGFELDAPLGAWVAARLDGRAPSAAAWIDGLRARGAQGLELVLAPGGAPLAGTVLDADGAPLARGSVSVLAAGDDAPGATAARGPRIAPDGSLALDAPVVVAVTEGAFAVRGVPAGALRIVCEAPGHRPLERVVRLPGEGTGPLALALEPAARVAGSVLDADGAPCPGAWVEATCDHGPPRRARCDADGAFLVDGLAPGRVTVVASMPGLRAGREVLRLDAGEEARWVARLAAGETIAGRAQGHGGPVARWLVRAVREDRAPEGDVPAWMTALLAEPRDALVQAYTDEEGRFVLPSEPGASYVLELRQRGAWRGPPQLRRAGVRSRSDGVRLVLDAEAGSLAIDLGARGEEAGLFVAVPEDGGSPVRSRPGTARIQPLPPGRYALHRWPVDGPPVDCGTFELGAGEALVLDLERIERR